MQIFTHTITNPRDNINKDRFYINEKENIFIICDGVSSKLNAGEAAQNVIDHVSKTTFPIQINKPFAIKLINELNDIVLKMRSGTTFTLLRLEGNEAALIHTGDSECYRIKNEKIEELTIPFTLAAQSVKLGHLEKEYVKRGYGSNVLLESLGQTPINPQLKRINLTGTEGFILCSDGANYCETDIMLDIFSRFNFNNIIPAIAICENAKSNGSRDDITAMVIKL